MFEALRLDGNCRNFGISELYLLSMNMSAKDAMKGVDKGGKLMLIF